MLHSVGLVTVMVSVVAVVDVLAVVVVTAGVQIVDVVWLPWPQPSQRQTEMHHSASCYQKRLDQLGHDLWQSWLS
jgi:hypothetical protein